MVRRAGLLMVLHAELRHELCHELRNDLPGLGYAGVAWRGGALSDSGRYVVTGRREDLGAFKTPTLREVARTAPYMHDGNLATLVEVIEFYDKGGNENAYLDRELRPLNLTPEEKAALLEFLRSLSGEIREGNFTSS